MAANPFLTPARAEPRPAPAPAEGPGLVAVAERFCPVVGRVLLAHIFLLSGVSKVMDWSGTAEQMAGKGMQMVPLFLAGAIACELLGGLSLLLGLRARLGALLLFLFLIPVTIVFHN